MENRLNNIYLTDILKERVQQAKLESAKEVTLSTKTTYAKHHIKKEVYQIESSMQEEYYGLKKGKYTLVTNKQYDINPEWDDYFIRYLSHIVKDYIGESKKVLVVGLGNRHISADSIGAKVLQYIIPTRYFSKVLGEKHLVQVSAISTSVFALTGIDSCDLVQSVVEKLGIECVIAIDSLCANDYTRLGTSFQIHDAGVSPGQGLGNKRKRLDKDTLGAKVITIGVPLVMYASSINSALDNSLVVTLKDIDHIAHVIAKYIGLAISHAATSLSLADIQNLLMYH